MRFPFRTLHDFEGVQRNFEALESQPAAGLVYSNTYTDFLAGFQEGQWVREPLGWIALCGLIDKATGNWVPLETIATLPAGARPAAREMFSCVGYDSGLGQSTFRVDVFASGVVSLSGRTGAGTPGGLTWLSLSGVRFVAA